MSRARARFLNSSSACCRAQAEVQRIRYMTNVVQATKGRIVLTERSSHCHHAMWVRSGVPFNILNVSVPNHTVAAALIRMPVTYDPVTELRFFTVPFVRLQPS